MSRLRFSVHAIIQMDERGLSFEDVRKALDNGEDIESRPEETPYPVRLVLGWCNHGPFHVAVRDNIVGDEMIIETAYQPEQWSWESDWKTRRRKR